MFSFQDFWQLLLQYLTGKTILYSEKESLFKESTYNSTCGGRANGPYPCQDELAAFVLKIVAIASILVAGIAGISIPLMLSHFQYLRTNGNLFIAMKAFAEGVILATGCVHMLWDAIKALNNPCLPKHWTKFPFTGIFFMVGLVLTLLLDVVGNRYMEQKQAAAVVEDLENEGLFENGHDALITAHIEEQETETEIRRHGIVSVILELGIVSHSVIVGLSLGVSVNPYEIRPLIVALCFHQFFEGFALGGSISQARFNTSKAIVMACLFALTMPSGVGIGTWLALGYNPNSPGALVVEGVLDSLSAGILIYTAVNMIKADFGSNIMTSNSRLFITSFCMVLLGIGLMSSLVAWA